MIRRRGATAPPVALAAVVVGILLGAPHVRAQGLGGTLERIDADARTLRAAIDEARAQYLQPEQILRQYSFATAYLDARYLHGIGSYEATVDLLLPLVEDEANQASAGYDDVVFLLAESLFEDGNLLFARRYYERLAHSSRYGLDSARRRIEIALAMGRYEALEELYRDLERQSGTAIDDQVAYVRGKALYFQGRYADAVDALRAVRADSSLHLRARYLVGVCWSRMGNYDQAHQEFDAILVRLGAFAPDESLETTDLRDLTRLAKGRLYYEVDDWLAAIDEYILVDRTSRHYAAALYEISWTQIRQGSEIDDTRLRDEYLGAALYSLEFLELIADPDSRFQAQAQLLRGDLLMRMERYDEAVAEFEEAAERYFPVELELRGIREDHENPDLFYDAVVNPETGSLRLPVAARPWFDSDPGLDRALRAIADVATLRGDIEETRQLVLELDAVLNRGSLMSAFPRLREGWGRATEVQIAATRLLIRTVDAESAVIAPRLEPAQRAEYDVLHTQRLALQDAVLEQPRTFAELGERQQAHIDALNTQMLEVHRTELRIREAREDLEALRELYIEQGGRSPTDELRGLRAEIEREEARLDEYERVARQLREDLRIRQVQVGVGDDVGEAEREARRIFRETLAREERFLAGHRSLTPRASAEFDDVNRLIGELVSIDRDCDTFFATARGIVAEQTADMRDLLERERANVERFEQELAIAESAARATAGDAAIGAFEEVYRRFSELTLRANLGIIDVAWQQKEALTDAIDALFEERNQSIRELDADFVELLEGE